MTEQSYNYAVWDGSDLELFDRFAETAPRATMRAPSFPLEDLASGATVEMKDLWQRGLAVIEFGSFT